MMEQEITILVKPAFRFVGRPLSEEALREHAFYVPLYPRELEQIKTFLGLYPGSRSLLVCGKEGVGKTTLVNKALADIGKRSVYDNVVTFRCTPIVSKDAAQIIKDVYQALAPLVRGKSQPKQFIRNAAAIAESLCKMVPGAKIKIVTEVKDRIAGEVGVSSTKIQIDGQSGSTVTLELPDEGLETDGQRLKAAVWIITQEELAARKPFYGVLEKAIGQVKNFGKNMWSWIKGRKNLYVIVIDGLHRLEKTPTGEQTVQECLELLSRCIEEDKSPFKVIAIAGPKTYQNWHEMGACSTRAFGVDDALYLPCAWENTDLVVRQLVEESQSLEDTRKTKVLNDLSAYLRFFGQGRIATTLLHLEKCCTVVEQAKKGAKGPCLQLNVDMETLKYVAELQRQIEKEILEITRSDFHWAEVELDDLIEEIYTLLTDLLRTPIGEFFEYDGQSYSFCASNVRQARAKRRKVGYPKHFEKALSILEKMDYIAQDVQIFPEAKKT